METFRDSSTILFVPVIFYFSEKYTHVEQDYESIFPEKIVSYASFGNRLGACIIDALILLVPGLIIRQLFNGNFWSNLIVSALINWVYYAIQESGTSQATIGKKAVGIKVTDEYGNRITFGQATGRFFAKYISGLILCIGYLMMLWDDRCQTLHDKMAGTLVVKN